MPRVSTAGVKCPQSEYAGSRVSSTAPITNQVIGISATSAARRKASRTSSPSFCPAGSRGAAPAINANVGSTIVRGRRPLAATSLSPGESPRDSARSAPATPTCRPHGWPAIGPALFVSTPRRAKSVNPLTASSLPIGLSSSRRSSLSHTARAPGRAEGSPPLDQLPLRIGAADSSGRGIP